MCEITNTNMFNQVNCLWIFKLYKYVFFVMKNIRRMQQNILLARVDFPLKIESVN